MAILGLNEATATKDRLVTCTVTRDYFPQVCLAGRGATRGVARTQMRGRVTGPRSQEMVNEWIQEGGGFEPQRYEGSLESPSNVHGCYKGSRLGPPRGVFLGVAYRF